MSYRRTVLACALMASATGWSVSGAALAQTVPSQAAASSLQPDMAMPDDLGAPLDGPAAAPAPVERTLSVKTSIAVIAANPHGRAVLEKDLPGLCERPEFMMFKGMSPAKLAALSHGRIDDATLVQLQSDLMRVSFAEGPRQHSLFTRSGRTVGRLSKAVYHRVALMIASL